MVDWDPVCSWEREETAQTPRESAENALLVMWQCNAWRAHRGNKKMRSVPDMRAPSRHFIAFVGHAKKHSFVVLQHPETGTGILSRSVGPSTTRQQSVFRLFKQSLGPLDVQCVES